MNPEEKIKIHFFYIVVILIMIITLVITDRWTGQGNFTEYLSNAATMTSLVLGLVAIFYSFISNDGLSKGLGNIISAADTISSSKEKLNEFLSQANQLKTASEENSMKLENISGEVQMNVSNLQSTLELLSSQTTSLHDVVTGIPQRFDELKESFSETAEEIRSSRANSSAQVYTNTNLTEGQVKYFLARSSVSGVALAYASILSCELKREMSLPDLKNVLEVTNTLYLHGYLVAMSAIGIINAQPVAGKIRVFSITRVHESLKSDVRAALYERIDASFKTARSKEEWKKRIIELEKFFT